MLHSFQTAFPACQRVGSMGISEGISEGISCGILSSITSVKGVYASIKHAGKVYSLIRSNTINELS